MNVASAKLTRMLALGFVLLALGFGAHTLVFLLKARPRTEKMAQHLQAICDLEQEYDRLVSTITRFEQLPAKRPTPIKALIDNTSTPISAWDLSTDSAPSQIAGWNVARAELRSKDKPADLTAALTLAAAIEHSAFKNNDGTDADRPLRPAWRLVEFRLAAASGITGKGEVLFIFETLEKSDD